MPIPLNQENCPIKRTSEILSVFHHFTQPWIYPEHPRNYPPLLNDTFFNNYSLLKSPEKNNNTVTKVKRTRSKRVKLHNYGPMAKEGVNHSFKYYGKKYRFEIVKMRKYIKSPIKKMKLIEDNNTKFTSVSQVLLNPIKLK